MSNANLKAVDTWDLEAFLAVLRQIAQDTGAAESVPGTAVKIGPAAPVAPLEAGQ